MKISEIFPAMTKSQKELCINVFLTSYQAILEAPEEEIMEFIIDNAEEEINRFPKVKEKVEKYKQSKVV